MQCYSQQGSSSIFGIKKKRLNYGIHPNVNIHRTDHLLLSFDFCVIMIVSYKDLTRDDGLIQQRLGLKVSGSST